MNLNAIETLSHVSNERQNGLLVLVTFRLLSDLNLKEFSHYLLLDLKAESHSRLANT